jgi:hypothetical protein
VKSYIIGALLGINLVLLWTFGILMTDHEIRIRHINETQMVIQAEMTICAEKVRTSIKELTYEHTSAHGGT